MNKMKFSLYIVFILISGLLVQGCQQRLNDEEKAREKAMKEIQKANDAINDYLSLVEERHVELLDIKITEMNKAMKKLRFERKGYSDSEDVEEKMEVLKGHKKLLLDKIEEIRNSCNDGCNDLSLKISSLLADLDKHLNLVDSLLLDIE
jgi:vacuolar-type H+-ATPase subunit I/STV1